MPQCRERFEKIVNIKKDQTPVGVLVLDKPQGITSMSAVTKVKRLLKIKKAGHTGTLDPLATGVLPICLGSATRIADYLLAANKTYRADFKFGITTDTDDAEGQILSTCPMPEQLDATSLQKILAGFVGDISQIPPTYSALKINGQRAYQLARKGHDVNLVARNVKIFELRLESWQPPNAVIYCEVSKGTYIRALVRDIGQIIGCGAHLTALRRLQAGVFGLDRAVQMSQLEIDPDNSKQQIFSLDELFAEWPTFRANAIESKLLANGVMPHNFEHYTPLAPQPHRVLSDNGHLLAIIAHQDEDWKILRGFPQNLSI